jgi:phospholipid/cholesterol/gamma-HCH transport system substrate-binding protein
MNRNAIETMLGAVVLAVAGIFVVFAYSTAEVHRVTGYDLVARFDHIDGVRDGGDVRMSGIKVGTITSTTLDPKTFQAVVRLTVDKALALPVDTVASITSSGLLGDKFLELVPGNDDKTLPPGAEITRTQSAVNLEALLGQAVFSSQGSGKSSSGGAPADGPTPSNAPPKP